jgi:ammonia channel protein AmtB
VDFAGGTVVGPSRSLRVDKAPRLKRMLWQVHMSSGFAALAGAYYIGTSANFGKEKPRPSHVPYVVLGTAMLHYGWIGFNGGSALAANGLAVQAIL